MYIYMSHPRKRVLKGEKWQNEFDMPLYFMGSYSLEKQRKREN